MESEIEDLKKRIESLERYIIELKTTIERITQNNSREICEECGDSGECPKCYGKVEPYE